MDPDEHHRIAYILTLSGGIVLLIGGLIALLLAGTAASLILGFAPDVQMGDVAAAIVIPLVLLFFVVLPLIAGVVTIQAARDYTRQGHRPERNGIKALVAGAVAFLGGGGLFIGALITVAGGLLMLLEPTERGPQEP